MLIDTSCLATMTMANQNFSFIARRVDEDGMSVILRNNKPQYVVLNFDEYDEFIQNKASQKRSDDMNEHPINRIDTKTLEEFVEYKGKTYKPEQWYAISLVLEDESIDPTPVLDPNLSIDEILAYYDQQHIEDEIKMTKEDIDKLLSDPVSIKTMSKLTNLSVEDTIKKYVKMKNEL